MTHLNKLNKLNTLLDWALYYQSKGRVVIPCNGKKPIIKWKKLSITYPEQIRKWWTEYPDANIGIKTGKESGVIVLDIDGEQGQESVKDLKTEKTPTARSGSGNGYHYYYKHPGYKVKNFAGELPGVDFRGDGGLIIAPPSTHSSGNQYEWITSPEQPLAEAPEWLLALIKEKPAQTKNQEIPNEIPEGERNSTLVSIAGSMRRRGLTYKPIYAALSVINENRCNPKLTNEEVIRIAESISQYEASRNAFPDIIQLDHITEIENPEYLNHKITVPAVVSSTFRSFAAPSKILGRWYDKEENRHTTTKTIEPEHPVNMKFVGASSATKHRALSELFPEATKRVIIKDLDYRTVYSGRVRPPVMSLEKQDDKLVDEKGYEYKDYTIYIVADTQLAFPASSLVQLIGYVLPDPNTQRTTLLVTSVEFPDAITNFDAPTLIQLKEVFEGKTVEQRIDWLLSNIEKYSQIIGRRNLSAATMLGFFTPTFIEIDGKIQRGWCNILILGDTTTAKTETVRKAIKLLSNGTIITAETATSVGLVGAATQQDKSGWSVDWGFLVLADLKLLAIDGAQKLNKSQWGALAEAERNGTVIIAKAAKDTAYARTRQIKIANPTDPESKRSETKNLSEFLYPAQAPTTFLDIQSVARLDLCVFADCDDVDPVQINRRFNEEPDPRIHLLSESLKWVWGNTAKTIFTKEAITLLHNKATELHQRYFHKLVPLASIDMKWKIARLAASLAAITLSTEDYLTITVTPEHVKWITEFIDEEYSNAGLDQLVSHTRQAQMTVERADEIITSIGEILGAKGDPDREQAYRVLEYIAVHSRVTKDGIKGKFELARDNQLRPLIARLNEFGLIKQSRGYNSTAYLIKLVRFISSFEYGGFSEFSAFSLFRWGQIETPIVGEKKNEKGELNFE